MKKLTVKTSKQTGYKYLEAPKVKKLLDELIDHEKIIEHFIEKQLQPWQDNINKRLKKLEKKHK